MTAIGIGGAFARIATIRDQVGSLVPTPPVNFAEVLSRVSDTTDSRLQTTNQPTAPRTTTMTLGDLVGSLLPPGAGRVGGLADNAVPGLDWATRIPDQGGPYVAAITDAANQAGIDPALLAALVWTESDFTADAVSHSGAIGLAQLMPATAEGLGVDPNDPAANLAGGARFLRLQLDRFGSLDLALAAYNAGPTRVRQAGGIPNIAETQAYVPKVLDRYRLLGGTP